MTKIKYCGITSLEDAELAIGAGATALGFNFYPPSPRYIDPQKAQSITRILPPAIWRVGVFVNESKESIERIARTTALSHLQFHGDETPEFCNGWKSWEVIKAIRLKEPSDLQKRDLYEDVVEYFLFDYFDAKEFGGTGKVLSEELLEALQKKNVFQRAFLAGGLTPENISLLVSRLKPFGVDVASGIESSPGKKDPHKMMCFAENVRNFEK